ncbi:uncharacterized protein LOC131845245 [Achroia grisella]|uniref:uncharacterized protein LOC131845245 n=1 Tax=Achroia grisella TaxID=688607 RepID=UPI0027D33D1A|nr:uncharacterized protein LOC131845245 [Achroia grisella]
MKITMIFILEISTKTFVFWPNGTIPFYINPKHFDYEQSLAIMTTLSAFAFKTCLKFMPALVAPEGAQHVLVFENPTGIRKCVLESDGHSMDEPHKIILGYECLRSPQIDMILMRALGFPFEHNRASRDLYVDVLLENIEPAAVQLFMKDMKLPLEWRHLPYDVNSVMHFGEREYSKNGHRTIMFKDHNVKQDRVSLTSLDIRKIDIVYGPECRRRDRQEKIELCQNYPGVARKKRAVEENRSLRVNPNITPPSDTVNGSKKDTEKSADESNITIVDETLKDLGIEEELQNIVDQIYKMSSLALDNAKHKYCNNSKSITNSSKLRMGTDSENANPDILGIVEIVANYAKNMVKHAVSNLTLFCQEYDSIESYLRARCNWHEPNRCPKTYKSTKSGPVRHSTQHRPIYFQSTKHDSRGLQKPYHNFRSGNENNETNTDNVRRKRNIKENDKRIAQLEDRRHSRRAVERQYLRFNLAELSYKVYIFVNIHHLNRVKSKRTTKKERDSSALSLEEEEHTMNQYRKGKKNRHQKDKSNTEDYQYDKSKNLKDNDPTDSNIHRYIIQERKRKESETKHKYIEHNRKPKKIRHENSREDNRHKERKRKRQKRIEEYRENNDQNPQLKLIDVHAVESPEVKTERNRAQFIPKTVRISKKNREFYDDRKWPDGIVRYIIKDDPAYDIADMRRRLEEVNSILKKKTCVKLDEITEEEAERYTDYLHLDTSPDYVTGRVGDRQVFGCLELFRGGQHRQHAAMMVMAMLGFYFEVARHDRDKYIRVHMRHVRPDKMHHFEKIREDATFPLPYDYASATHPAWQFWRKIGKTGISTVATYKEQDSDGSVMKSLGQNENLLSELDLIKINTVYGIQCFRKPSGEAERSKKRVEEKDEESREEVRIEDNSE